MKGSIGFTAVFALIFALCISGYSAVTLPVTDNFPSGGADLAWSDFDSEYELIESFSPTAPGGDGYIMNVNDGSGWQILHLTDDDGSLGDYKISAYIYVPSSDAVDWGRVGIYGRSTSSTNHLCGMYYLFADTDGDDYLRCGRYVEGHADWFNYIDPPGTISRDAWHKFELSLDGTEIVAEIDDVQVYSGNDATDYSTGWFGILTRQYTASAPITRCDRITVESLVEPPTSTPTDTPLPPTPTPPSSLADNWELLE